LWGKHGKGVRECRIRVRTEGMKRRENGSFAGVKRGTNGLADFCKSAKVVGDERNRHDGRYIVHECELGGSGDGERGVKGIVTGL
jgi:hypothetical protein